MNGIRRKGPLAPSVGSFVPRLTRKAMEKYGFSAAALITDWAQIVGPELARYTEPQQLKWPRGAQLQGDAEAAATGRPGATLVLRVDGSRALDVQYNARQIMERINGYFGYRAVAEMRLVQAPVDVALSGTARGAQPRQVVRPRPPHGSTATRRQPAADLSAITDDRLRASLERLQQAMTGGKA